MHKPTNQRFTCIFCGNNAENYKTFKLPRGIIAVNKYSTCEKHRDITVEWEDLYYFSEGRLKKYDTQAMKEIVNASCEWQTLIKDILNDKEFNEYWEGTNSKIDLSQMGLKYVAAAFYIYGFWQN